MPVNLASIRDYLLPGLMSVQGKYKDWPKIWPKIYISRPSKMNFERNATNRYLGLAQQKAEGQAGYFDNNAGERWMYVQDHLEVSIGYAMTSRAIEDNLYERDFNPSNLGLQRSHAITEEVFGANIFNLGTTYVPATQGDGQPLFSTAHPNDITTLSNMPTTAVDLSESSLLNAAVTINATFLDEAGLLINAHAKRVMVPPALEPVIARLTKSEYRPGTGDNDINVIPITAGGIKDYIVNPYLTSSYAWFVLTDVDGFLHLNRIPYESTMWVDNMTNNLLVAARQRYSFGYKDWRAGYGSFPTS